MSSPSSLTARFCLTVGENDRRCIFAAYLRPTTGDVVVSVKHYPVAGVKEERYSIHWSRESQIGSNTIKRTYVTENGEKSFRYLHTLGIKKTNKFTPIFLLRLGGDLKEGFEVKTSGKICDFGYMTWGLTFIVCVVVSSRPWAFSSYIDNRYSWNQIKIGEYYLVCLWTFLGIPANSPTMQMIWESLPETVPGDGYNEVEMVAEFWKMASLAREEALVRVRIERAGKTDLAAWEQAEYYSNGVLQNRYWQKWIDKMCKEGLINNLLDVGALEYRRDRSLSLKLNPEDWPPTPQGPPAPHETFYYPA